MSWLPACTLGWPRPTKTETSHYGAAAIRISDLEKLPALQVEFNAAVMRAAELLKG